MLTDRSIPVDGKVRATEVIEIAAGTGITVDGVLIKDGKVDYDGLPVGAVSNTVCAGDDPRLVNAKLAFSLYTVETAISASKVVAASALGPVLADPYNINHRNAVLGVTLNASNGGGQIKVVSEGTMMDIGWDWTVGQPVWLGASGSLTQTYPADAKFALYMGIPYDPDTILLNIGMPVALA